MGKPKRDTQISKTLSYFLRHGAREHNLDMDSAGFVSVPELLKQRELKELQVTRDDIERVVRENAKQRFCLSTETDRIRANQGHSLGVIMNEKCYTQIRSSEELPICIHATLRKHLPSIQTEGLKRMARDHIHFTTEEWSPQRSMTRASAEVDLYIDVEKAMEDGHIFWRTQNNVILTEGPLNYEHIRQVKSIC